MNLKQFLERLDHYFFTTLHLVVAFLLLWGLFYIRLLPRVSRDLWENLTHFQLFITLFTIFCIIANIYNTLKFLGRIKTKEPPILLSIYIYPLEVIYDYIIIVLKNFYEFIWFVSEKISVKLFKKHFLHLLTLLPLVKSFTNPKYSIYYFYLLLSLRMLPRIIFVAAFIYDVFFCKRMDYTFRCIPLLLIPLLEPFFLHIMKDYYHSHILNLASFIKMETDPNSDLTISSLYEEDQYLPFGAKDLDDFFENYFHPVDQILLTVEKYEAWKTEKIPTYYIQLILQMLRLSAYCYILFYGIL